MWRQRASCRSIVSNVTDSADGYGFDQLVKLGLHLGCLIMPGLPESGSNGVADRPPELLGLHPLPVEIDRLLAHWLFLVETYWPISAGRPLPLFAQN